MSHSSQRLLTAAAPPDLREKLRSEFDAEDVVELQLKNWRKAQEQTARADVNLEIYDISFQTVQNSFGDNPLDDIGKIKSLIQSKSPDDGNLWNWTKLPYSLRCAWHGEASLRPPTPEVAPESSRPTKKAKVEGDSDVVEDLDAWVIANEAFLRLLSRKRVLDPTIPWSYGLVRIRDFPHVFPNAKALDSGVGQPFALKVTRGDVHDLPGFIFLHNKIHEAIYLQPTVDAFKTRWDSLTGNVLKGLDWSNIFVAGGTALACLLTPNIPADHADSAFAQKEAASVGSDIDLYIYGMRDPQEANKKIAVVVDTYRNNLPAGSPFLIVRNSQTITLYSEYPRKRVQIVLKMVDSPRDVLLNFDLDICAVGFDGSEVWLLPRCVRALETGTTMFTMDLINGHYLGDRKSTRDTRVFKYANKGYGLRIPTAYTSYLSTFTSATHVQSMAAEERWFRFHEPPFSLHKLADESRTWTRGCIDRYMELDHGNIPFHWPSGKYHPIESAKPVFSHAMLESRIQRTKEPLGRSCLTSFSLLMRHVALWEEEVKGNIVIYDKLWAENTYGEGLAEFSYDDTPAYEWDESFTIENFKRVVQEFNSQECSRVAYYLANHTEGGVKAHIPLAVARLTYGTTLDEVYSKEKDIAIPLIIPTQFLEYASRITMGALRERGVVQDMTVLEEITCLDDLDGFEEEVMAIWYLNRITQWQLFDRRIDEIREVLWAFHRASERVDVMEKDAHNDQLATQLAKRAIRETVREENDAFVAWVGRKPVDEDCTGLPAQFALSG